MHTVILAGSVLKVWFPWDELIDWGFVGRLVNECGTKDSILLVTQFVVLLTGMAGRIGFSGLLGDLQEPLLRLRPRGSSGRSATTTDRGGMRHTFMRKQWVPLLTADAPIPDHDEEDPAPDPASTS